MIDRRFLDVSLVVSGIANEPTANPTNGTQYIVGPEPMGDFTGAAIGCIARYNGTTWKFLPPTNGGLEALNAETGQLLGWNGSEWVITASLGAGFGDVIVPVLDIVQTGTTLPEKAEIGDSFLDTESGKIYTAIDENTWDEGTALVDGDRYASLTDNKVYEVVDGTLSGIEIPNRGTFLNKADNYVYIYDEKIGTISKASATAVDLMETVIETHTLTAEEVTAKSFMLKNTVASEKENAVLLSVCGIAQAVGTDFSVSGKTISWNGKGLGNVSLMADDVFIIHYIKA